jgi:Flp pilus assembly protein TadD
VGAAKQLGRARRIWSASGERAAAAYADLQLARLAGRQKNVEGARELVGAAAAEFRAVGETRYSDQIELALAEAEALGGDASRAVTITGRLGGSGPEPPSLKRIRGMALARLGSLDEARRDLDAALAIARRSGALYDIAATLEVLRVVGADSEQQADEREELLERLGVERLPAPELGPVTYELAAVGG